MREPRKGCARERQRGICESSKYPLKVQSVARKTLGYSQAMNLQTGCNKAQLATGRVSKWLDYGRKPGFGNLSGRPQRAPHSMRCFVVGQFSNVI
jgi:hypothetical protein